MGETVWSLTEAARKDLLSERERRALLDALGHSPDCVAPDHYRRVWQEERDRAVRGERGWLVARQRNERLREALERIDDPNSQIVVMDDGHPAIVPGRLREIARAALSADADADAEPGLCSKCDGAGAIPSGAATGTLWNCTRCHGTGEYPPPSMRKAEHTELRITPYPANATHQDSCPASRRIGAPCGCEPEPSRAEGEKQSDPAHESNQLTDAEGGRPREADEHAFEMVDIPEAIDPDTCWRCGERRFHPSHLDPREADPQTVSTLRDDASVDGGGDDGYVRAVQAAIRKLVDRREYGGRANLDAVDRAMLHADAAGAVDAALASGGVAVVTVCPDCSLTYDATHVDERVGGYWCPACEAKDLEERVMEARAALQECSDA